MQQFVFWMQANILLLTLSASQYYSNSHKAPIILLAISANRNKINMIDWFKKTAASNKPKISGNHKFFVKPEPDNIDISSTINVTAFTDKTESALVPCHYRWFKIRNGITQQITKFKGSSYMCDPSDIGAVLYVQICVNISSIQSNDPEYSGKALVQFEPVRLTIQMRRQIQNTLTNGSAQINASITLGEEQKECQLKIFEDMIKVCHMFSDANFSFEYSIFEPKIQFNRDQTKVDIIFDEKHEHNAKKFMGELFRKTMQGNDRSRTISNKEFRIALSFQSKFLKDLFILTLKSFYTKRQIKNSVVIHRIEHFSFKQSQNFDFMFEIESLRVDLARVLQNNEKIEADKNRYKREVVRLEKEIEEIIMTYTKIVEDKCRNTRQLNQSFSVLSLKRDEVITRKYQNLEHENLGLNERIRQLSSEIDEIRFNNSIVKNNQTKIHDNPPFIKRNYSGEPQQDSALIKMLDQLSISHVREVPEEIFGIKKKLSEVSEEKSQLQKKLERSFQKIDNLEKQLRTQGSNQNHTAINFSYASNMNSNQQSRLNMTMPYEDKEKMQKIIKENSELRRINDRLKSQNEKSRMIIKNSDHHAQKFSVGNHQQENQLFKQIQNLKNSLQVARDNLEYEKAINIKLSKQKRNLEQRVEELKTQIQMFRKNQDVFNRSQNLSMEMNDYNEEQVRILKEHNDFLTSENEKLSAACEKYMKQAKENIKLRKDIVTLKEKLNAKILNPEHTVMSIQL